MSEQPASPENPATRAGPEHRETESERLDRNLIELLNELRVSGTGIQVLLAFLLVVPFDTGYKNLTRFDKDLYFVSLAFVAGAAACLIAPSIHHRILFRHGQRPFIIGFANRLAILGTALLAIGLVAILILIGKLVFGSLVGAVVGAIAFLVLFGVWFGIPIWRRLKYRPRAASEELHELSGD